MMIEGRVTDKGFAPVFMPIGDIIVLRRYGDMWSLLLDYVGGIYGSGCLQVSVLFMEWVWLRGTLVLGGRRDGFDR